jgi:hypothetical protein
MWQIGGTSQVRPYACKRMGVGAVLALDLPFLPWPLSSSKFVQRRVSSMPPVPYHIQSYLCRTSLDHQHTLRERLL